MIGARTRHPIRLLALRHGGHWLSLVLVSAVLILTSAPFASAAPVAEVGDAGDLPATAQDVTGTGPLDSISGTIEPASDKDVYRICLTGGQTFSATTVGGATIDTQLFLFDSAGLGVYANDDTQDGVLQSTLPSGGLSPSEPGVYYLAISTWNYDPVSSEGLIFPDEPITAVVGPTGPGGGVPISGWQGDPGDPGPYTITLTGATFCPAPTTTTQAQCRPGWGKGDKNHCHSGPPGQTGDRPR